MLEPKQERSLDLLRADFRERLKAWLAAAKAVAAPLTIGVHETLRSQERQDWLWASGRSRPGPIVTWVKRSKHQDGIAADWHLVKDGKAIWDAAEYQRLYSLVPPEDYGLRTLVGDLVHLELDETIGWGAPTGKRLLIVLDANQAEVFRLELPDGSDVLTRVSADGSRVYVRPDAS